MRDARDHLMEPAARPLYILSFRQRDELAMLAARGGWQAVAARRADDGAARFVASGAAVVVLDARGALEEGLAAAPALAAVTAARGGALLVLVSRTDVGAVADFFSAGATHFLASPFAEEEFLQALRFAARHGERVRGVDTGTLRAADPGDADDAIDYGPDDHGLDDHGPDENGADRAEDDRLRTSLGAMLGGSGDVPVHVMIVALNRLDIINAAYGRRAGDMLLQSARGRIEAAVTDTLLSDGALPIVGRVAGSAFAVMARAGEDRMALVAGRIADALSQSFSIGDRIAVLGCRIGLAAAEAGDDAAALLQRAGSALAEAQASDTATLRVADGDSQAMVDTLAVELSRAMEAGEIDVLFQPQVDLQDGSIVGVEALARWEHHALGAISAEALFAAAARADLGIALSDHIQRLALAKAAAWPGALAGLRLAVNLTAADIARPGFAALFMDRVDASGFPRGRLTIEITESGLIEDLPGAAALLAQLRAAGCRIAIDDFGTGYSSLAYLKALPVDYLKIDKGLAQDIGGTTRDRIVVRAVLEMARALGIAVVAEGVETIEQRDLLASEGCRYYQGFLCSGAVDTAALADLVTGSRAASARGAA